jgi:2-oxoglutarate ferredoxin oxidoreductase subunit alpha
MSDLGGEHRYNVTGLFHDIWGFPSNNPRVVNDLLRHLNDKIDNNVNTITRYKEHFMEGAEYILISYGSSARSAIHLSGTLGGKATSYCSYGETDKTDVFLRLLKH